MTAVDLQRRSFLFGRTSQVRAASIRPPWALDETAFLSRCDGCGACLRACPGGLLGTDARDLPARIVGAGECDWCGDCAAACPSQALDRQLGRQQLSLASIAGACLNASGVHCSSCRDACPERAIAPPPARLEAPRIDADRCTGCGACVPVCPTSVVNLLPWPEAFE